GVGVTRIHATDGATLHSLIQLNRSGSPTFTFEDFTLDGNKNNGATITTACLAPASGLQSGGLSSSASVFINRVELRNSTGRGIGTGRTRNVWRLHQVVVRDNDAGGLLLAESTSFHSDCQYLNNGGPGFSAGELGNYHIF